MSLENFTVRDRIWLHHKVGLRCQTTADQLRQVLAGIRRLLEAHPKVDSTSARIRFIGVSGLSLDLEIFAYVLVSDQAAFLAIQEDLLLDVLDVIDASGTSLASPLPAALLAAERALDA
jgi:MscS family membrane protein